MMSLFSTWFLLPLIGVVCGVVVYPWVGPAYEKIKTRSLSKKQEILRLLDLMFVETSEKKITWLLSLSSFGLGFICILLLWPSITAGLILGSIVTVAMWSLPLKLVKNQWEKRCSTFTDQMIDGLTIMANGVRSGLSITQTMERVVESLPNPISQEFGLVLSQIRIGRSVEEALIDLGERIPRADVQMFVTAINILKETGGNMAETFSTIVTTIRERQKVEKKIDAMTAQGVMQGLIVSLVPIGIIILLYLVDPAYVRPMFTSTLGLMILFATFTLVVVGGIVIRKIVTIKV